MNKKKRRKPSKADIRKAWSENRRRENRRKGAVEAEKIRQEQREAKYIASADPDEAIPWCKNCRAHTYYDTDMSWDLVYDDHDVSGEYRRRIAKVRTEQCVRCKSNVAAPAQMKRDENTTFFKCGAILLSLVAAPAIVLLVDSNKTLNKTLAVGLLTAVTLSFFGLAYCAYRGQLSPSYHSWLQWAKKRKETI